MVFDVPHLYYLPQFIPVFRELQRRSSSGFEALFLLYSEIDGPEFAAVMADVAAKEELPHRWVKTLEEGLAYYEATRPTWIVFGNEYKHLDELPKESRHAMVNHGAGIKSAGHSINSCRFTVRFAEGPYQLQQLKKSYPPGNYVDVGFAKLDPLFRGEPIKGGMTIQSAGLDPNKKTLLYAPTFYPSSLELFPDHWPREFAEYNLVVKPHFFTYTKARYRAQRKKLERWKAAPNVRVASVSDYTLLPFFAMADVLISDASTALFEFAALNKPVVWCDFLKLRWTYRGPFAYRFKNRMDQDILRYADIAVHAPRYADLHSIVADQLAHPAGFERQRREYAEVLLGKLDGHASTRIVDYLLGHHP